MNFHGGDVYKYDKKLLDFSSNINPLGVPTSFYKALQDNINEFTKYPDIQYVQLRQNIADYLGVQSIEAVVPGNGAVELLYKAIQQSGKNRLISLKPTFSEYARAALQQHIEYVPVDAFAEEYTDVDIDKLLAAACQDSAVIICNPNNPTGTLLHKERLLQLAAGLREKGAMLIVDEAFMEFTPEYPEHSMLDQIESFENMIIVKAATKFFGMPGIRLGYAISGNKMLLQGIQESMEPWNINTAAVIAGTVIFKDEEYIADSKTWINSERPFLYTALSKIREIKIFQSAANFHLLKVKSDGMDAARLKELMLQENILIRTPDGFEGLDNTYFRLAVKDRPSNIKLMNALDFILNCKNK